MIPKTSPSLKLVQRIRDEAHRFAITFHRDKRSGRTVKTELEEIEGVGPKTARKLLNIFGSVKEIRQQPVEMLQEAIGDAKGQTVYNYFQTQPEEVD